MQLLSEDVRTDRRTDMANLKYAPLKLIVEKVLRIIAALVNRPVVPEVTTLPQLTLPLGKQSAACGKEAELDHSSHSYCTPSPHQHLTSSAQKKTQKLSTQNNTLLHWMCKSRSYRHISFNFLQIYFWFHIAVTNSWPWRTVTSLRLPTQTVKFGQLTLIHYKANINRKYSLKLQTVSWFCLSYLSYLSYKISPQQIACNISFCTEQNQSPKCI